MKPYSPEEIAAIVAWYEANTDRLPATVELMQGEMVNNVHKFVQQLLNIAKRQGNNPTFTRQIQYLFDLKAHIENT